MRKVRKPSTIAVAMEGAGMNREFVRTELIKSCGEEAVHEVEQIIASPAVDEALRSLLESNPRRWLPAVTATAKAFATELASDLTSEEWVTFCDRMTESLVANQKKMAHLGFGPTN